MEYPKHLRFLSERSEFEIHPFGLKPPVFNFWAAPSVLKPSEKRNPFFRNKECELSTLSGWNRRKLAGIHYIIYEHAIFSIHHNHEPLLPLCIKTSSRKIYSPPVKMLAAFALFFGLCASIHTCGRLRLGRESMQCYGAHTFCLFFLEGKYDPPQDHIFLQGTHL